jgi:hypothetical protein
MHLSLKSGVLITALVLLPNLAFLLLPPTTPSRAATVPIWLTIAENAARIAILLIPCFYAVSFRGKFAMAVGALALLALVFYYAAWIRYFAGGREAVLLGAPLMGVPLPLATAPSLFLLLSACLLGSWPMLGAAALFAVFHIWVSALTL